MTGIIDGVTQSHAVNRITDNVIKFYVIIIPALQAPTITLRRNLHSLHWALVL